MMKGAASVCIEPTARLIVNADDFGQTAGINRAVLELHQAGVLTSATLMARAAATDQAIEIARATLHHSALAATLSSATANQSCRALRSLHCSTHLPISLFLALAVFLERLFTGRIRAEEIEAETTSPDSNTFNPAEFASPTSTLINTRTCFRACCVLFSAALVPVAFSQFAIPSNRPGPFAPPPAAISFALLRSNSPLSCSPDGAASLPKKASLTTSGTLGVSGTGALDTVTIHRLLDRVPAGTWELVTHPGYNDADLARIPTRLRASRDMEREALPVLREFPALRLIRFSALTPQH